MSCPALADLPRDEEPDDAARRMGAAEVITAVAILTLLLCAAIPRLFGAG